MRERPWLWWSRRAWLVSRSGIGEYLLRVIILDFGLIVHDFVVRGFEQLFATVLQLGSNFLLDPRIREFTLAGRFHGDQLDDQKIVGLPGCGIDLRGNDLRVLAGP